MVKKMQACTTACILALLALTSQVHALLGLDLGGLLPGAGGPPLPVVGGLIPGLGGLIPGVGGQPLPVVGGLIPGLGGLIPGVGGPPLPVVGGLIPGVVGLVGGLVPGLGGVLPGVGGPSLPVTGGLVPGVKVPQLLNCDPLKLTRCVTSILQAQTSGVVNVPLQTCCAAVLPCFCILGSDLQQQLISSAAGQPLAAACGASTPTCT